MSSKLKNFLILIGIFSLTFLVVFFIRDDDLSFFRYKSIKSVEGGSYDLLRKSSIRPSDIPLLSRLNGEYATVTDAVIRSVVSLDTIGRVYQTSPYLQMRGWTQEYNIRGMGSGVIVSRQGHIITNTHVVENKQAIQVTLYDGRTFEARKIGEDKVMDIAVLKIDAGENLSPLAFGNSDNVQVGEIVFAFGNPFGLGETVTQGIISAKQRSIGDLQSELLQTDAAINPGNSGGPLINIKGEIIGINAAIYSNEKDNARFQGVGFSIPSNVVRTIFEEICEFGKPIRGYIGLVLIDVTPRIKNLAKLESNHGVAINSLHENSPAYKAGLRPGDIILTFDGEPADNARNLLKLIHAHQINKPADITYWRRGVESKCTILVAEAGVASPEPEQPDPVILSMRQLGLELRDLSLEEFLAGARGVLVTKVTPNSEAAKFFRPGHLITTINGHEIYNRDDMIAHIGSSKVFDADTSRGNVRFTLPQAQPVDLNSSQENNGSSPHTVPTLPDAP